MGAIDNVRNVMQDFLASELRELKARIDVVERQVQELKGSIQQQFQQAEKRREDMIFLIRQGHEVRSLAERLAAVEEKLKEVRH